MSAHAVLELVRCSTARIRRAGDKAHLGTGFFAAPGRLLTAAHVVAAHPPTALEIVWDDRPYPCTDYELLADPPPGWGPNVAYPWPDVAILEIDLKEHPCVPLAADWPLNDPATRLWGWSFAADYRSGVVSGATISGGYHGRARPDLNAEFNLVGITENRIIGGMSGAPLLDTRTLQVCAIVKNATDRKDLTGYATAIADVWKLDRKSVKQLRQDQGDYLQQVGADASAEAKARWGELPERVARIIRDTGTARDFADELARRGVAVNLTLLPEEAHPLRIAQRLYETDAKTLAHVLSALKRKLGELTVEVYELVACCLPIQGPDGQAWWWIPPEAAEQFFREADATEPRVAHVCTDERDAVGMLVQRASGRGPLTLAPVQAHDDAPPGTTFFQTVERLVQQAAPGAWDGWWSNQDDRDLFAEWLRGEGLVLELPRYDPTAEELDELRRLGSLRFVLAGRKRQLPESERLVRIQPEIDSNRERWALAFRKNLGGPQR